MDVSVTFLIAAALLVAWVVLLGEGWRGWSRIPRLQEIPSFPMDIDGTPPPLISVVIAARNEERRIAEGLQSLLAQDYPHYEIIVVNDRSEDRTGEILSRLEAQVRRGRLKIIENTELPPGWLGKCHALHRGASAAQGDYLLFTDADVVFAPDVLRRIATVLTSRRTDMLCVFPNMIVHSVWERVFILGFAQLFFFGFRPWRSMEWRSNAYVGVGAFNLVRRSLYERIGGHRLLKLHVVDDVALGKLIKYAGGRVLVARGEQLVQVRWQESFRDLIRGMEKNAFAGMHYSITRTVFVSVGLLGLYWGPWLLLGKLPTLTGIIAALTVALQLAGSHVTCRSLSFPRWIAPSIPLGVTFFVYAVLRSAVVALHRGGITWRNDFYSLEELRRFFP